MNNREQNPTEGEELFCLSVKELSCSFGVSVETITEIIEEGIVNVVKNERQQLVFDSEAFYSVRTVLRLNRDLGVNLAGAGLALQLLKKIEQLETLLAEKT